LHLTKHGRCFLLPWRDNFPHPDRCLAMFGSAPLGSGDGFGGAGNVFGGGGGNSSGGFADEAFGLGASVGGAGGAALAGNETTFRTAAPEDNARRWAGLFERCRGPHGFVEAEEGRRHLESSGLSNQMLQNIWHLSDLDRDGRLSLREFVCALQLVDHVLAGRPLPAEVTPEQQLTIVHGVDRYVGHGGSSAARGQDEFSTIDTTGSLFGTSGRRKGAQRAKPPRIGEGSDGVWDSGLDLDSASGDAGSAYGSRAGLGRIDDVDDGIGARGPGLGQLAAVLEVVSRLDSGGELKRLSREVLEERKELERQLSRRRDFEHQLKEVRSALDTFREQRRQVEMQSAAAQRKISHLQDETAFVEAEARQAEDDLGALRDAGASGGSAIGRGPAPYATAAEERRDVLSKVRAERELLQRDQRGIEELRSKLDEIFALKKDTQARQQALLEKQRQTEQDRGLMLTAIEAERGKLSAMRAERLRLCEDRSSVERDMTDIAQQEFAATNQVAAATSRSWLSAKDGVDSGHRGVPATGLLPQSEYGQQRGVLQEETPMVVYGSAPDFDRPVVQAVLPTVPSSSTTSVSNGRPGGYPGHRVDTRGVRN